MKSSRLRVERRHRPRAVDADEPIGLRTADRGIRQRPHRRIIAQRSESLANRRGRHGLQPEALDGLSGSSVANDVAENQFPFPPGVAGVDQGIDVLAFDELDEQLQARLIFLDGLQVEMGRDDRQMGEGPFAAFDFVPFRNGESEQVAHRRREHVTLALVVIVLLFEPAERLGDIAGDGRFLGNDQRFCHGHDRLDLPATHNYLQDFFSKRGNVAKNVREVKAVSFLNSDGSGKVPRKISHIEAMNHPPHPPFAGTLSPSEGERDGVRGHGEG